MANLLYGSVLADNVLPDHALNPLKCFVEQMLPKLLSFCAIEHGRGPTELSAELQVRVWLRPMAEVERPGSGDSSGSGSGSDPGDADFAEYSEATGAAALARLARGWTAFVVGIVSPRCKASEP